MANVKTDIKQGVRTETLTLNADGSYNIAAGITVLGCRVDPAANLAGFKIGSTNGGAEILAAVAVLAADGVSIQPLNVYAKAATTIYFGGITSQTTIKLYKLS